MDKSLEIENILSTILIQLFRIPKTDLKTLSNKSSAISFKTKVDLLYDLDRISKEHYNLLLLFMEIRNQFIHNIEATSFTKVFEILGIDRRNRILKLDSQLVDNYKTAEKINDDLIKPEIVLSLAFDKLKLVIDAILVEVVDRLISDLEKENELRNEAEMNKISEKLIDIITKTIDDFGDSYEKHLKRETGKDIGFDITLSNYVNVNIEKKLKEQLPEIFDKDKNVS